MRYKITTTHADFERLFGGSTIIVEGNSDHLAVAAAENPELIGQTVDVAADSDLAEQLAAMYAADVEALE